MNIVGIITIISIILGLIASKYMKQAFYNPNKNYSKLNNFCSRVSKCDDFSYKGNHNEDPHWNRNVQQAKQLCNKTGKFTGDDKVRNMFKCFFDDTTDPDNPRCIDCATQITLDDDEYECKKPGHDLNIEDTIKLPNFNE